MITDQPNRRMRVDTSRHQMPPYPTLDTIAAVRFRSSLVPRPIKWGLCMMTGAACFIALASLAYSMVTP